MFVCLANDVELLSPENYGHEELFLMKWDKFYSVTSGERTQQGLRWTWGGESFQLPALMTHTCAYPGQL